MPVFRKISELDEESIALLQKAHEINILMGDGIDLELDPNLFFGPLEDDDVFLVVDTEVPWSKILVACGLFKSRRDAKGAGWDKPVENGFNQQIIGKFRRVVTSLHIETVTSLRI